MSRIGEKPVQVPSGVTIEVTPENLVKVKGSKGQLEQQISQDLKIEINEGELKVTRSDDYYKIRGQHGLARTLIANMVEGVTNGHTKILEIHGIGYKAQASGNSVTLNVGYSHPVIIKASEGVSFEVFSEGKGRQQNIKVMGIDKQAVGQIAADIRAVRKPDPYKGKGVRYAGEVVKLKPGKKAGAK